jgi:hypothetical protein
VSTPHPPGTLVAHKSNSDPELDVAFTPQVLSQKGEDMDKGRIQRGLPTGGR